MNWSQIVTGYNISHDHFADVSKMIFLARCEKYKTILLTSIK